MPIVYRITNSKTKQAYIGWSIKTVEKRFKAHLDSVKFRPEVKSHFFNSIRKHGPDCWVLETLHTLETEQEAKNVEIMCIDKYDTFHNGYNSTKGGEGALGRPVSKETREKHRINSTGKFPSEETKRKISEAGKGRIKSPETCKKLSEMQLGEKNHRYGIVGGDHPGAIPVKVNGVMYDCIKTAMNTLKCSYYTIKKLNELVTA